MKSYDVVDSQRKVLRYLKEAVGDDILRFIAELVTNSDDSYRRIESELKPFFGEKKIIIRLEKDKRTKFSNEDSYSISVIDNAEGMTYEDLHRIFVTYGEDNAGGVEKHARGVFGQGASDVLRAAAKEQKTASIYSFKDGKVTKMLYNMEDFYKPKIALETLELTSNALADMRKKFQIPYNGTIVSFGIPSNVKFNKKIKENLAENIEKYPSFRYLLNRDDRKIIYECDGKKSLLSSVNYQFKEDKEIFNDEFVLNYEGRKLKCKLRLFDNENKKDDNTNIIVIDENYNVYDNTMFGHENNPSAKNISGELMIQDLYKVCYDHINLQHDTIVRDNRTGFDVKHDFYKTLDKVINPKLISVFETSGKKVEYTNLGNNKKFSEALRILNKYLSTELKDEIGGGNIKGKTPPVEGIKFIRSNISITKGKEYSLKLLINSSMISYNDRIVIDCKDDSIEVSPNEIIYLPSEIDNDLVIKNISIRGIECTNELVKIQAKANCYIANVLVEVIEDEIHYPENGLEFYPQEQSLVYNTDHKLKLYIDTNVIPLKSRLEIKSEFLEINNNIITVSDANLLNNEIAMVELILSGGEVDNSYEVIAKYADIQTVAKINLIEPNKNNNSGGGLIADIKLAPNEGSHEQVFYHEKSHIMYINPKNSINIKMMGEMDNLDPDNPVFDRDQRKYLCDIISTQAAGILVKRKNVRNGEINFEDFEEAVEQVQNLIQIQKNIIYNKIYDALK